MTGANEKVLIIVENESVPFDSRVWKEAQSLHEHGYHVTVLCPKRRGYRQSHQVLEGVHIYRHPTPPEGNSAFGYLIEFACALFWEFLFSWWIYLRHGFHVIQGCNPPDTIFLIALPFKLLGVKYIFDHHDANPELYVAKYDRKDFLYRCQVKLERLTYRFSDIVMATNVSYKQLAISRGGLDPDSVFVVRNGPSLDTFKPVPAQPALKHGKPYLVAYVGTMSTQEGLDILLDVASHLKSLGHRDIHFTCVGSGPGLAELRQMVRDMDLGDIVNFTGRVPDKELLEILSTADVCVNPDKPCEMNDISTMIKIMEYMALGKPIVQFDLKEGRFSAQDASLYAERQNSVVDFAAKILWLLENPEARRRMGESGIKRVGEALAWEYSVPNLLAAYGTAFGKSGSRSLSGVKADAGLNSSMDINLYYSLKPLIPRKLQLTLRQRRASHQRRTCHHWPISLDAGNPPLGWPGWPEGKRFAVVLTHDVEGSAGIAHCEQLARLNEEKGLRCTFGFVPLRYETPGRLRRALLERGHEVVVHDLYHDGKLFRSLPKFTEARNEINRYLQEWKTRGFSSGAMHHNLPWISQLNIDYSTSTYDVDPFEPQACGSGRIFPYWVQSPDGKGTGFVELPYTLPQDFTLFILLQERSNAIWRKKLDWIATKGGMALIKTHPDYMVFPNESKRIDGYPAGLYSDLLNYITERYEDDAWFAQPSEVASYWRGLRLGDNDKSIEGSEAFCASCRQAHAAGWLREGYPRIGNLLHQAVPVGPTSVSSAFDDTHPE
jgi:glycosyltransferase involved in cell wall biosynthesis